MKCVIAIIVFAFVTNDINSAEDLQCYECLYFDGHPESDPSCKDTPSSSLLKTCASSPPRSKSWNGTFTKNIPMDVESDPNDHKVWLCVKATGILDNKPVIGRECSREPAMFNGTCTSDIVLTIDGRTATDPLACMCDENQCNEAVRVRLTYVSLLIVTFSMILYQT